MTHADHPVLLVGDGELAQAAHKALTDAGANVLRLRAPHDRELRAALARDPCAVAIVFRDDIRALRSALFVEHLKPGVRLIVTIFGRTVAAEVERAVPDCHVLSLADAAAPALVASCLGSDLLVAMARGERLLGVRADGGRLHVGAAPIARRGRPRRLLDWVRSQLRPLDTGSRMLLAGAVGIVGVLIAETLVAIALGETFAQAGYSAVKTATTVGPNALADAGPAWLKLASAAGMLCAGVSSVLFTAGLVNRLLEPRLTGIFGSRTIPRSGHVVVVGLGQIGLRLCLALRALGVPVLAVEQDPRAPNVRIARERKLPVVIGHGGSRFLLRRLSLHRARALAAVTSDDGTNVAIAVAARATNPDIRVVLRAGGGAVTAETQALFHIGLAHDVLWLGGAVLAARALDLDAVAALVHEGETHVVTRTGDCLRFPLPTASRAGRP